MSCQGLLESVTEKFGIFVASRLVHVELIPFTAWVVLVVGGTKLLLSVLILLPVTVYCQPVWYSITFIVSVTVLDVSV